MLHRRNFLSLSLSAGILLSDLPRVLAQANLDGKVVDAGRIERPQDVKAWVAGHPRFVASKINHQIRSSGRRRVVRLWKHLERAQKHEHITHEQEIGDCVSQASTLAAECLSGVQIVTLGKEEWRGKFSTEVTYGGCRVEIGKKVLGFADGAAGVWAAEWLNKYGIVLRDKYGKYDLTTYNAQLAKQFGARACPTSSNRSRKNTRSRLLR